MKLDIPDLPLVWFSSRSLKFHCCKCSRISHLYALFILFLFFKLKWKLSVRHCLQTYGRLCLYFLLLHAHAGVNFNFESFFFLVSIIVDLFACNEKHCVSTSIVLCVRAATQQYCGFAYLRSHSALQVEWVGNLAYCYVVALTHSTEKQCKRL